MGGVFLSIYSITKLFMFLGLLLFLSILTRNPKIDEGPVEQVAYRLRKMFNIGGLKQLQIKRLREAFTGPGVQGAGPLAGVGRGGHPLA